MTNGPAAGPSASVPSTSTELVLPLVAIALGAFVIGTEGFMLAGILPAIDGELGVSIAAAGELVTVFSLTFAIGSPVVAIAAGNVDRRRLLLGARALIVFALGTLLAAGAHAYGALCDRQGRVSP